MAADATQELRKGLEVRAADGRRLGTLVGLEGGALVVERGFFWPQRFTVSRGDVGTVVDGQVRLLDGAVPRAVRSEEAEPAVREPPLASVRAHEEPGDVRVPLAREDAWAQVRTRDVGAVRVRKVVRTELKQLTVEVRREELVVERIPIQPGATDTSASASGASGMFEELEQVIPLWREDVEVAKRPVVYEEVHLKKAVERRTWTEEVPLRREEASVEEEGDTHSH